MSLAKKIYAYRFLSDFMVLYALFAILLEDNGLTTFQISTLLIAWSVTALLCEVPSGVWADKYSRRNILALGELVRGIGWLVWLLFPTYPGFFIGFLLWGLKNAMISGTFQAFVYDELRASGQEGQYTRIMGSSEAVSLIAIVSATIFAPVVLSRGFNEVIITSMISALLSMFMILLLPEVRVHSTKTKYLEVLRSGVREIVSNNAVKALLIFGALVGVMLGALGNYTTLLIRDLSWPDRAVSVMYGAITLLLACASYLAYRFRAIKTPWALALLGLSGICLIVPSVYPYQANVLFVAGYLFLLKLIFVIYDGKLQTRLPSDVRATATSIRGLLVELGNIGVYLSFGILAALHGRSFAFGAFGWLLIMASLLFFLVTSFNAGVRGSS